MRIIVGSDHAGFDQKESLRRHLKVRGHTVTDAGAFDTDSVDYPDLARTVGVAVADGSADAGVLVCGTGIGMAMAANKVPGVRAANVTEPEFARLAREHNDANVVTLSGRFVGEETNAEIVDVFLSTPFGGGRHEGRVGKIAAMDGLSRQRE
jgi:ribose 5-phosphate isomerase B